MRELKRSYETLTKADLERLLRLSRADIDAFFERYPRYGDVYRGRECLIALCQGAALHYIDGKNGIKDFDVWFFYPAGEPVLPYRRRGVVDFGPSKFGRHPDDPADFQGRRIDVLMRSEPAFDRADPKDGLDAYLTSERTTTAGLLSKKAVVGLYPDRLFGQTLWSAHP